MMKKSMILISLIASILMIGVAQALPDFTVPESVLLGSEYNSISWGTATVVRTNPAGDAVRFAFSGLTGSSTGMKDDYQVADYGQILPSHGSGDFSNFGGYSLWVKNDGTSTVSMSIFMNTGFTGPSGDPSNDPTNDTWWQSSWTQIQPGESTALRLDFGNAIPNHVEDNKHPHTLGGTNGIVMAINTYDRSEVSAIGFQITGSGDGAVLVAPATTPAPGAILLGSIGVGLVGWLRRRRTL